MMANMPIIVILFSLSWIVGMVIFANYADCDPLSLGYISKIDEIVPFYVEDKLLNLPGMLGLVMATLFNSALTLAVSNLNSLATVTFEDFLSHIPALKDLKDTQQLNTIKIIGFIYGLLIIGISFLVAMLSGVIESSMLMTSATSGPLLGVFLLAMLVPCANWKGAAAGMIFSHITTLWITFGHLSLSTVTKMLPLSTEDCHNETFSSWVTKPISLDYSTPNVSSWTKIHENITTMSSVDESDKSSNPLNVIYGITYMYYAFIGSMTTVIVGILVSLITADAESDKYEEHLLHPIARKVAGLFPGKQRLYASSTRLGNKNDATNATLSSVASIAGSTEKGMDRIPSLQGFMDDEGKLHLENSYVEKLNALKNASIDVTNEIGKHTRL